MIETEKLQRVAQAGAEQRCVDPACGARFELNERLYVCPNCGGLLDVILEAYTSADPEQLRTVWTSRLASFDPSDRSGVWRYRELLPFAADAPIVTLAEGNTPLYDSPSWCRAFRSVTSSWPRVWTTEQRCWNWTATLMMLCG